MYTYVDSKGRYSYTYMANCIHIYSPIGDFGSVDTSEQREAEIIKQELQSRAVSNVNH